MGTEANSILYNTVYPHIKNKLVFDIGSNTGKITKNLIDAGAKVVAIEPLSRLTAGGNYKGAYAIKNVCISDKIGKVKYNIITNRDGKFHAKNTCFNGWKKLWPTFNWAVVEIESTTLDALIEEFGKPVYIKIDVEGYEHKVLGGLSHRIDFISFEFTSGYWETFSESIKVIEKLGFRKISPFMVKKTRINGKKARIHDLVGEFYNISDVIKFFKSLPMSKSKDIKQGDILIES